MQSIILKNTNISLSRFIFGTASLFNVGSRQKRGALLAAAVDAGFTHFDTAPYYGFGLAESDLSAILKANPLVTFTTKVGIHSPGGEAQSEAAVFLRKAIGRVIPLVSRPTIDFSLQVARTALEGSLRRTGRETVDIYTLHEPELHLLKTEEWRKWLESCIASGKVRTFGLALTSDRLEPFLKAQATIGPVVQLCDSLEDREADILKQYNRPMQITYGYVSAALKAGTADSIADILRKALQRNREGAIIVSSTKIHRLSQYAAIAEEAR